MVLLILLKITKNNLENLNFKVMNEQEIKKAKRTFLKEFLENKEIPFSSKMGTIALEKLALENGCQLPDFTEIENTEPEKFQEPEKVQENETILDEVETILDEVVKEIESKPKAKRTRKPKVEKTTDDVDNVETVEAIPVEPKKDYTVFYAIAVIVLFIGIGYLISYFKNNSHDRE